MPAPQNPIFISYGRADGEEIARAVYDALTQHQIAAWMDVARLSGGVDWDEEIDKALYAARAVAVVLTPGAVLSQQVKSEWNFALNREVPIIPLLAYSCEIPRVLSVFNYIDLRDDFATGIDEFLADLAQLDARHYAYLQMLLRAFEAAQKEARDPRRFETKINNLHDALARWQQSIPPQEEANRITNELTDHIQENARLRAERTVRKTLRVIGMPPVEVTTLFKNRQQPRQEIGTWLADPNIHLVSIIGRGGMGKSALACYILHSIEQRIWPQGGMGIPIQAIIYLSTRTTGITLERIFFSCIETLQGKVAADLNALWANPQVPAAEKITRLLLALQQNRVLLLLDNLEDLQDQEGHLRDDDMRTFIEMSLIAHHSLCLIVTSRIPLALRRDLAPFDHRVQLQAGLPTPDGVQLLRELDAHGDYGLRDLPEAQLTQAVEATYGVPRALEVIVGLMANDPFSSLPDILGERIHKNPNIVQALVEDNYGRLNADAQRVVEALAIYGRPVPVVAIEYLLQPFNPGIDVPRIVRRLSKSYVINVERRVKTVSLHPIDRDYAYSRIPESDEEYTVSALERRAADYYKQLEIPKDHVRTLDDLDPYFLEFEHRVRGQDYNAAALIVDGLDFNWLGFSRRAEAMAHQLDGKLTDPHAQTRQQCFLGIIAYTLGALGEAQAYVQRALDIAHACGDLDAESKAAKELGSIYRSTGDLDAAIAFNTRAATLARAANNAAQEFLALFNLSLTYAYQGKYRRGLQTAQIITTNAQVARDQEKEARGYNAICLNAIGWQHWEEATDAGKRALALYRDLQLRDGIIYMLNSLGLIALGRKQTEPALLTLQEALTMARTDDFFQALGIIHVNLAHTYRHTGELSTALTYAQEAVKIFAQERSQGSAAAQALAAAIQAHLNGDAIGEARALFAYAGAAQTNADLYGAVLVATEVVPLAQRLGQVDLVAAASTFIQELLLRTNAD